MDASPDMAEPLRLADLINGWRKAPRALAPVAAGELAPHLRALLAEDGTVTNLLSALSGEPVVAEPVEGPTGPGVPDRPERRAALDALGLMSRHILLVGQDSGTCYCYANSLLVLRRLPQGFLSVLRATPAGIGAALRTLGIETRRAFLWHGFDSDAVIAPAAAAAFPDGALSRCYEIVHGGETIVLIRENFPAHLEIRAPGR